VKGMEFSSYSVNLAFLEKERKRAALRGGGDRAIAHYYIQVQPRSESFRTQAGTVHQGL